VEESLPSLDHYTWLFLGLSAGFALVAIVLSWASADHGLRDVMLARRSRDEKRDLVNALKQREPELVAEYTKIYGQIRQQALIVIERTNAEFQLYLQTVRKNSRYSDIDMNFPDDTGLPPGLAATEPPALPKGNACDEDSEEQK
jgi:hypothetical protein